MCNYKTEPNRNILHFLVKIEDAESSKKTGYSRTKELKLCKKVISVNQFPAASFRMKHTVTAI